MTIDVATAINVGVSRKERQQWPLYTGGWLDRTAYVTASEVGYCARKIWLDKEALKASGYRPEEGTKAPDDWGMLERGHAVEAWAVDNLARGIDVPLLFTGNDQVSFVAGHQAATPDGVFQLENGTLNLEVKSIDPRTNWAKLPKEVHVDQVMQSIDLVSYNMSSPPLGGVLIYIDASDYKKKKQFDIEFSIEHAERLEARAELIMTCTDPANLEPEGMFKDHCKYCKHTARCSALNSTERNEVMRNGKFEELAKQLFG